MQALQPVVDVTLHDLGEPKLTARARLRLTTKLPLLRIWGGVGSRSARFSVSR